LLPKMQALVKKPRTSKNPGWVFRSSVMIVVALIVLGSCGETHHYPSVSFIAEEWLAIKTEISSPPHTAAGIEKKIADFHSTLDLFLVSPVGSLYQIHRPDEMKSVVVMGTAAERLQIAVHGDDKTVQSIILEIDSWLNQLQRIDQEMSDITQMRYFWTFLFFIFLVTGIFSLIVFLSSKLRKAENRERQSLAFSRETVMAQEQERSRIALELHDTVAQDLLRFSLQAEMINKNAVSAEQSRLSTEVSGGLKETLQRIRNICDNLIPPDLQHRHLPSALKNLCYTFEQRTGIECHLTLRNDEQFGSLDSGIQLQCFRIVQECLANIEKHAGADEVSVLAYGNADGNGALSICVSDNGKGFTPPDSNFSQLRAGGSFGLWGMHERAAVIGGTLIVESVAGEGSAITLRITVGGGGVAYDSYSHYRRPPPATRYIQALAYRHRPLFNCRYCDDPYASPQSYGKAGSPSRNHRS
jgi:signal transduction histidine kinase